MTPIVADSDLDRTIDLDRTQAVGLDIDLDRLRLQVDAERSRRLAFEKGQANAMTRIGELADENERLKEELAAGVFRVLDSLRAQLREADSDRALLRAERDELVAEVGKWHAMAVGRGDELDSIRCLLGRYLDDFAIALAPAPALVRDGIDHLGRRFP